MIDLDLVVIFAFIIVITTILGISVNAIISKVHAQERWERENERESDRSLRPGTDIGDRMEMIEDRLHVLERLATDRGRLLADKIEALRDERASEGRSGEVGR